jgi:hypothetical protein
MKFLNNHIFGIALVNDRIVHGTLFMGNNQYHIRVDRTYIPNISTSYLAFGSNSIIGERIGEFDNNECMIGYLDNTNPETWITYNYTYGQP